MFDYEPLGVMKTHPTEREMLPEDPLELRGHEMPGDARLMLTMLVEEMARMGWNEEHIVALTRDPFYQALYGLWRLFGEVAVRREIRAILARVGVSRVRATVAPTEDELVQIQLGQIQ